MFLTPFLILVTIFYVIPAVLTVVMSFTNLDSSFVWEFNHFKNFIKIFKDPNTLVIVRNTLIFVGVAIVATVFLNLLFAVLTTYFVKTERYSSIFKAILMIPMITPAGVYSVLWVWLLG